MTATVTEYIEVKYPDMEVVILTASDGETYRSRKFATIRAATATPMEDYDTTANVSVAISSGVATIHSYDMTDVKICLTLYGNSGN